MIKDNLVKKCLEMFAETPGKQDTLLKFFDQFGTCLKYPTSSLVVRPSALARRAASPQRLSDSWSGCGATPCHPTKLWQALSRHVAGHAAERKARGLCRIVQKFKPGYFLDALLGSVFD